MNLCGNIPKEYCGDHLKLCIRNEKQNFAVITGDQFSSGKRLILSIKEILLQKYSNLTKYNVYYTLHLYCFIGQSENLLLVSPKSTKCDKNGTPAKVTIKFICSNDAKVSFFLLGYYFA